MLSDSVSCHAEIDCTLREANRLRNAPAAQLLRALAVIKDGASCETDLGFVTSFQDHHHSPTTLTTSSPAGPALQSSPARYSAHQRRLRRLPFKDPL